jgi:beta-lactam-binding protein with PASTA domain
MELGEVTTAYLPTPQADTVLLQQPAKGTAAESPRVDVLVAAGERPASYVMPSLVGMEQASAERLLAAAGMLVSKVDYVTESGSPTGTVVSQAPPRGARLGAEGPVQLGVAR